MSEPAGVMRTRCRLPAHPRSVAEARDLVRSVLAQVGRGDLADSAELLVSEIVTNAVLHAGTPVEVEAVVGAGGLRVEVSDGSPHLPVLRRYARLSGTGRGMQLLEQFADAWGVRPGPVGKSVWFQLGEGRASARPWHGAASPHEMVGDRAAVGAETQNPAAVDVVLLAVPALLHEAWQAHAESLLREYLMIRLDDENAGHELEAHATVKDAMALLREHIPAPEVGADPEEVMLAAAEPVPTAERVLVSVPPTSVAHFRLLDERLDVVAALADAGALLTAPAQPELRELRRWLCRQVLEQACGGQPQPWVFEEHPSPSGNISWDADTLAEVMGATEALIAADDTNRIVAVSGAALALLGHGAPSDLVGRRIVEIIPDRYRQAHLAGFSLHLSSGRRPLLGRAVTVPALRRDGTEIIVALTVNVRREAGNSLYVADLRPPR